MALSSRLSSLALLGALSCGLGGCPRAPTEPSSPAPPTPRPALPDASLPSLEAQTRRVLASLSDGGVAPEGQQSRRLELPLPSGVDVVAVQTPDRWTVAALEPSAIATGISGAERVLALWRAQGHAPTAVELARVIGAFVYYPHAVFVTREALPSVPGVRPLVASGVTLAERPGGTGRSLTFSYLIEGDRPGAGLHVAHFNVTHSGLVIDEAPNPALR